MTNPWANIPKHYAGRWGFDYDEKRSTFFVHCGGHRILDAEDSEVAHAVCLAHNRDTIGLNWELSEHTKREICEIEANSRSAMANAKNVVIG